MECLRNRLESFSKPVRVQNPSKAGASKSIKWPHPDTFIANPTSLAEAGFYFNPSHEDRDNVTCFTCDKQLSEWEADDDPFDIHWEKCAKVCCWAIVRCARQDLDSHGRFAFLDKNRLPSSKFMEKARLQTYSAGEGWFHDNIRNHGASSRKMAKAGFVFTPEHEGDDLATCLYCGVCLSSWDAEDDPLEQHRKRKGSECPFFNPPSPPEGVAKGRSASGTSKPSSRVSTAPTRTHTRGRSRSGIQDIVEQQEESATTSRRPLRARKTVAPAEEATTAVAATKSDKPRSVSKHARKPSRSRKVATLVEDGQSEDEPGDIETQPARTRKSSRSQKTVPPVEDEESEAADVETQPATAKTRKSSRSQKTVPPVEQEESRPLELESQDGERPGAPAKSTAPRKPSRSRKTVAPPAEVEEPQQPTRKPKTKSKSGTRKTQLALSPPSPLVQAVDDEEVNELVPTKEPPKSKKAAAQLPTDEEMEDLVVPKKKGVKSKKAPAQVAEENASIDGGGDSPTVKTKAENTAAQQEPMNVDVEEQPNKSSEAKRTTTKRVKKASKPEHVEGAERHVDLDMSPAIELDEPVPTSVALEPAPLATIQLSHENSLPLPTTPHLPPAEPMEPEQLPPIRNPQTPAHEAPEAVPTPIPPKAEYNLQPVQEPVAEFTPFLSKLPFTPLHSLSEAELDMTVEEWIRYQIEVEYDKFKRDGERELLRFRKRAEEVRKIIERL